MHLARKALGARAVGTDSEIGTVIDFYCEDGPWAVRYLLVGTGGLSEKRLLIPTMAVQGDWDVHEVHISLTKGKAWDSPRFQADKPVSRESEATVLDYYGHPYCGDVAMPMHEPPPPFPAATPQPASGKGVPYDALTDLWSVVQRAGYHVRATNGEIGLVDDFLIRQNFRIPFLIVDASNWLGGKSVVVPSDALKRVDREHGLIYVNTTRDRIKHAPTL
jgi:hypothetical protein